MILRRDNPFALRAILRQAGVTIEAFVKLL